MLSISIPLVPPLENKVAVVAVGSGPVRVVGTEKDITHPALLGQPTGASVLPLASTLRKIQSAGLLNTSVTGEQVVPRVESASTLLPLAAMALELIRTW